MLFGEGTPQTRILHADFNGHGPAIPLGDSAEVAGSMTKEKAQRMKNEISDEQATKLSNDVGLRGPHHTTDNENNDQNGNKRRNLPDTVQLWTQ